MEFDNYIFSNEMIEELKAGMINICAFTIFKIHDAYCQNNKDNDNVKLLSMYIDCIETIRNLVDSVVKKYIDKEHNEEPPSTKSNKNNE